MKARSLTKIIGANESVTVEWKPSLSQINEIINSIAAFSNSEGGKIFIGVSRTGQILGTQIGRDTVENLANQISQHIDPKVHPRITTKNISGRELIIIDVKRSPDRLTLAFGRPYVRVGKSTMKMSKDEYEKLILEKHINRLQFDRQICRNAALEDIDRKKVSWYLKKREEIRKFKKPGKMPYKKLLINIGAAEQIGNKVIPTNAGILFFGKYPKRFFIQSQLRIARFKGTSVTHPVIDRLDSANTLWEMAEEAEGFIRKNIRLLSFRTEVSFMREDKFEYPIRALREAIINALIHRDYRETSDTRVFIFDDRVEIINPGSFPKGVTPDKPVHKAVNPGLCSLMYDIGFIEKYGSGIYLMKELCQKWKIPPLHYELHPIETKIIFKTRIKESTLIELEKKSILRELNSRQKKAIEYIKDKGSISRKEYLVLVDIAQRQANKDLEDLLKRKIIVRIGKGRSIRYIVHD